MSDELAENAGNGLAGSARATEKLSVADSAAEE